MSNEIETAINALATKAEKAASSLEAMQFAQAALSLAHTSQVKKQTEVTK